MSLVQTVRLVNVVLKAIKEMWVRLGCPESESQAIRESRDLVERQEKRASEELPERRGIPERMALLAVLAQLEVREMLAVLALMVNLELRDPKVSQVQMVYLGLLDLKERTDRWDLPVLLVPRVRMGLLD